jgi:hypothetical protein
VSKKEKLSRAAIVRQRRAERQAKEARRVLEKSVVQPVAPIRTPKKIGFVGTKKRKKKLQRYEATAFAPVSEGLQSLELPKIRIEWRAASAALAVLLTIALYLLFTLPAFTVSAPKISGNQYISAETLNKTLAVSGKNIFTLVPHRLERELLLAHPGLAEVEVSLSLPNITRVTVRERQPALIWEQDGKVAWIDAEGIAFRATSQADGLIVVTALGSPPAPVVETESEDGLVPPPYIAPETVLALQSLVTHVPAGTPIIYDPQSGLGWTDPRGWTVQLGDITEEIGLKLRIYETLVAWFEENHIYPVLVNLEYPRAPYYRMEP